MLAAVAVPAGARAAAPSRLVLEVRGECPDRASLQAALAEAFPGTLLVPAPAEADPANRELLVEDRGEEVRVDGVGAPVTVRDPARRCAERANRVALLVALTLDPPGRDEAPPPPPATAREKSDSTPAAIAQAAPVAPVDGAATAASATTIAPSTPPRWMIDVAVAGTLVLTPQLGGALAGGGAVRLTASRGAWGATLGIAGLSPATLRYEAGQVDVIRVPVDLGVDLTRRRERFDLGLQLGAALVPVVVRGGTFTPNRQATGVDAGARLALVATVHATRWLWPQLALEALALPLRSTLAVTGQPDLGDLPFVYLGASLGVAWRFPGRSAAAAPTPL